jgi:hypothetical protein
MKKLIHKKIQTQWENQSMIKEMNTNKIHRFCNFDEYEGCWWSFES